VAELDFRTGLGNHQARTHGSGPRCLISDLGQFDFNGQAEPKGSIGMFRLVSRHPGVNIDQIKAKTGFVIDIPSEHIETTPPSIEELKIDRVIDPLGIRD
jgi:acyl CoA:acetate/3-ketoacid CoA transferase beta subunit